MWNCLNQDIGITCIIIARVDYICCCYITEGVKILWDKYFSRFFENFYLSLGSMSGVTDFTGNIYNILHITVTKPIKYWIKPGYTICHVYTAQHAKISQRCVEDFIG